VPKELSCATSSGERAPLHPLWNRRFSTKFNGVGYVTQRAAEALYSPDGKAEVQALIGHYMENASILLEAVRSCGLAVYGGANAPYIWVRGPQGMSSWEIFDKVLGEAHVVVTPGSGFGPAGEGYFRISAFNSRANAQEAASRLCALDWK
jgi:LL-diaminopimelate aminotransferase